MIDHTSDAKDTDAMRLLERELWDARIDRDQQRTVASRLRSEVAILFTTVFLLVALSVIQSTILAAAGDSEEEAQRARLSADFWHHAADDAELRARTEEDIGGFWRSEWKACAERCEP